MVHGAQLDFRCLCSFSQLFLSAAEPSYTHAGMLMALGLTGHLRWAGQPLSQHVARSLVPIGSPAI